jgi:cytochrome c
MKHFIFFMFMFFSIQPAMAQEQGTAKEAIAMVQKTISMMKKSGVEAILAEINKRDGTFKDRDLYVVVYDMDGVAVAHLNPRMAGKNLVDLKDVDGKYFVKERIALAKTKGTGWQDYKFVNPESKVIEAKSMYIERYQNYIVGCGIYKKS